MMYRPDSQPRPKRRPARKAARRMVGMIALLGGVGLLLAFMTRHWSKPVELFEAMGVADARTEVGKARDEVYRVRLKREAIPQLNYHNIRYRELFNDSNYVQLAAARAGGIDPDTLGDPALSDQLVPIFSNDRYSVDTMWHAVPYLTPEAALLVHYIAERFALLMGEHYPQLGEHRVIVTSALRTEQGERRLRRVNRNATDTSCHVYGTTFDLSAQRYEHVASGHDTVVDACKQMLAMALYELRKEGLCYVKYERGSCFHITVRTTQYEGKLASEQCCYVSPGSPVYLKSKAVPRPKPPRRTATAAAPAVASTPAATRHERRARTEPRRTSATVKEPAPATKVRPAAQHQSLSDRERLSLEQFERNY